MNETITVRLGDEAHELIASIRDQLKRPQCVTCKHWNREADDMPRWYPPEGWAICERINEDDDTNPQARIVAYWSQGNALVTSADFGCALHETEAE